MDEPRACCINRMTAVLSYAVTSTTEGTIDLYIIGKSSELLFDAVFVVVCKGKFQILLMMSFVIYGCWLPEGISRVHPSDWLLLLPGNWPSSEKNPLTISSCERQEEEDEELIDVEGIWD